MFAANVGPIASSNGLPKNTVISGLKWINYDPILDVVTPFTNLAQSLPATRFYDAIFYAKSDTRIDQGRLQINGAQTVNGAGNGLTPLISQLTPFIISIVPQKYTGPNDGASGPYPLGYASGTFTFRALDSSYSPVGSEISLFLSEMDDDIRLERHTLYPDCRDMLDCAFYETAWDDAGVLKFAFELFFRATNSSDTSVSIGHILRSDLEPLGDEYTNAVPVSAAFSFSNFPLNTPPVFLELRNGNILVQTIVVNPSDVPGDNSARALAVANWLMTGTSDKFVKFKRPANTLGFDFRLNINTSTPYLASDSQTLPPGPYIDGDWRVDFIIKNFAETQEINRVTKLASLATLPSLVYSGLSTFLSESFGSNFRANCFFTLENIHPTITLVNVDTSLSFFNSLAHSPAVLTYSGGSSSTLGTSPDSFVLALPPGSSITFNYTIDNSFGQLVSGGASVEVRSKILNPNTRVYNASGEFYYVHTTYGNIT